MIFDIDFFFGVEILFIILCVVVLCFFSKKSNSEFKAALLCVAMMVVSVSFLTAVAWLM